MKKILNCLFFCLFLIIFFSCTLYRNVPIEVFQPKEVKLPSDVQNIGFIYRNFKFTNDTLQQYFLLDDILTADRFNKGKNIDSLMAVTCLQNAANEFQKNGVCRNPVIFPVDIFPRQTGENIHSLPPSLIKKLAMPAKAGYLVFLETLSYFFSQYNLSEDHADYQQVKLAGIWSLYDVETGEIADSKTLADTIYWDYQELAQQQPVAKIPPRLPAMVQAAGLFGENYSKRFYSGWKKVDRLMVIPPLEDFRMAAELANEQQWDKARDIWEKYADPHLGRLSVSACYNMALAFEISDDLEMANQWIDRAVNAAKRFKNKEEGKLTLQYQSILATRMKEIEQSGKVHQQ